MKKIIYFLIIFFFSTNSVFSDDESFKILIKVNKNIITNVDIMNEANYLKVLNTDLQQLEKNQIFKIAENSLIREFIKKDEIEKYYDVNYSTDTIDKYIVQLFQNLGFSSISSFEKYLSENKIKINEVKKKLVIEKTWNNLIYETFRNKLNVDEEKIAKKIDSLVEKKTYQKSYRISEIIFTEKNKTEFDKKYDNILKDIKKLGFSQAAVIHSISNTAKLGGGIGWVNENELSKKIYSQIKDLKIGEFSNPIRTGGGTIILQINEIKDILLQKINKDAELKKMISFEKNRQLNEYSVIHYKKIENLSYVERI